MKNKEAKEYIEQWLDNDYFVARENALTKEQRDALRKAADALEELPKRRKEKKKWKNKYLSFRRTQDGTNGTLPYKET